MGCAQARAKVTAPNREPVRSRHKIQSIDCRRKSALAPDSILENVRIVQNSISSAKLWKIAENTLEKHNLFCDLNKDQILQILTSFIVVEGIPGQNVFSEGDKASSFFIIAEGEVEVLIGNEKVRKLCVGDSFGELALIYFHLRSATIKNISPQLTLLCIKANTFQAFMSQSRRKNIQISKQLVSKVQIFQLLSNKQKYKLAGSLIKQKYQKGEILFEEGEIPYSFYIIYSGKVQIQISEPYKKTSILGRLQSFGESVFKPGGRREGTAKAIQDLVCFTINEELMKECIGETVQGIIFHHIKKWALKQSQIFSNLNGNELDYLSFRFTRKFIKKSEAIIKKGEKISSLIICIQGRINNMAIGTLFHQKQYASWVQDPNAIIQSSRDLIKNDQGFYAEISFNEIKNALKGLHEKKKNSIKNSLTHTQKTERHIASKGIVPQNLVYVKKLGEGQFGSVHLVKERISGMLFAVKMLEKQIIKDEELTNYVVGERQILSQIYHPLVVGFYRAFEDQHYIYFFMEHIEGIEMFEAIRQIGILNKSIARYYFGSLLIAIQALHEQNVIYRDIKPENSMVTSQGKIMLIDLGTCKKLDTTTGFRTSTIIGTPHYMAPEVMIGKGYSFEADYWSLGIIFYELVCGRLPFAENCDKAYDVYSEISKGSLSFPKYVSDSNAKKIISSLLNKNPNARATKNGLQGIKHSQYFTGFSWQDLEKGTMLSPYIPKKYRNKNYRVSQFSGKTFQQFIHDHSLKMGKSSGIKKENIKSNNLVFKQWESNIVS